VEFDITGTLRPQLAKAMPEVSKDSLIYTFDLRDDVLFQDGTPLTSEDVKYSIEYTINPANKASRGPIFQSSVARGHGWTASVAGASERTVRAMAELPDETHGCLAERFAG
jgi:ABC-type transport system substrate-binding protein